MVYLLPADFRVRSIVIIANELSLLLRPLIALFAGVFLRRAQRETTPRLVMIDVSSVFR